MMKFLKKVVLVSFLLQVILMLIGFVKFTYGPIQPCEKGYCGKRDTVFSEKTYQQYTLWENFLKLNTIILFPSIIGTVLLRKPEDD
jgi:hypothetical protein